MVVNVVSPAATRLQLFGGPPAALLPDSAFTVQVAVVNAVGNLVTTPEAVTLAIGTNPGGGTLTGIKTVNTVNGVATFTGLRIASPGVGYTLTATSGSLPPITTGGFSIVLPPTQIAFRIQPVTTYATRSIPTVQVELRDDLGTRVLAGNYSVTLAIGTNPAAGTLSGTTGQTSSQGVASFGGLSINNKGVGYTLTASVAGLPNAISVPFNITGLLTLFTNGTYVQNIPGDLGAEASNMEAGLNALGLQPNTTTDISDAGVAAVLATSKVYVIPEQEVADLTAALGAGACAAIVAFVNGGGTLVVHNGRHLTLMNTLFGLTITAGGGTSPYTLGPAAAGTPFAGGPASLLPADYTEPIQDTSLPVGSQLIYRSPSTNDAAVAVIPRGTGRIVYMGWDWFNAQPVGSEPGGLEWLEVLRRATQY